MSPVRINEDAIRDAREELENAVWRMLEAGASRRRVEEEVDGAISDWEIDNGSAEL